MSHPKAVAVPVLFLATFGLIGCGPGKNQGPTAVAPGPNPAPAPPGPILSAETPIKVGGGSMTFFSSAVWNPDSTGKGWCAQFSAGDISIINGERFYDSTGTKRQPEISIAQAGTSWTITILGHANDETKKFKHGDSGVTMQASQNDCSGQSTGPASVTITPVKKGDLKTYGQLATTSLYVDNHRYADPNCTDRDRCERMAQISISNTSSTYDNVPYGCPDGECRLHIGPPKADTARPNSPAAANSR